MPRGERLMVDWRNSGANGSRVHDPSPFAAPNRFMASSKAPIRQCILVVVRLSSHRLAATTWFKLGKSRRTCNCLCMMIRPTTALMQRVILSLDWSTIREDERRDQEYLLLTSAASSSMRTTVKSMRRTLHALGFQVADLSSSLVVQAQRFMTRWKDPERSPRTWVTPRGGRAGSVQRSSAVRSRSPVTVHRA